MAGSPEGVELVDGQEDRIRPNLVRPLREAYLNGKSIDGSGLTVGELERVMLGEPVQKPEVNFHPLVEAIHSHLPKLHWSHRG